MNRKYISINNKPVLIISGFKTDMKFTKCLKCYQMLNTGKSVTSSSGHEKRELGKKKFNRKNIKRDINWQFIEDET